MVSGTSDDRQSKDHTDQIIKEDGYEPVSHEDAETPSSGLDHPSDDLALQRFQNSLAPRDDEDDSDEDEHTMSHPIFGMLAGRLGQRLRRGSSHAYDKLHPENQVLTVANVEDCVEVENEAFPEAERCTREKFEYRLSKCPELCLGIFSQPTKAEVEKGQPQKRRLIAHIVATRTSAPAVTNESMDYPRDWKTNKNATTPLGHEDTGDTICIHSIAVRKDCQKLGIGSVLVKSYIQRLRDAKVADRLALLAHENTKKFYTRFGFDDMGPSSVTAAGGNWSNMILDFSDIAED